VENKEKSIFEFNSACERVASKSGNKGGVVGTRKRKGGRSTGVEPDEVVNSFGNVSGFFDQQKSTVYC